jgi:hypothetical protein
MPTAFFRRPRARRIVFGGDQPVARVERGGHRRAQVHVPEPEHQVAGAKHDVVHVAFGFQAVDATDELDVARAPGRIRAHQLRVLGDRQARRRIIPGERQAHLAALDREIQGRRQLCLRAYQRIDQFCRAEHVAIKMDLQGTDAGRDIDDAGQAALLQPQHQRVHAQAQPQIEDQRAIFDEQVFVACLAVHHPVCALAELAHDGAARRDRQERRGCSRGRRRRWARAAHLGQRRVLFRFQRGRAVSRDGHEAHAIPRAQLTELPQFRLADHGGADKAAQAGPVGSEQDGHVPRKIDAADRVGHVVDVRGVQTCLAAISTRPGGLRSDQAHARAVGLGVHLPVGVEQHLDIARGEEIRGAVRAVQHADLPMAFVGRA